MLLAGDMQYGEMVVHVLYKASLYMYVRTLNFMHKLMTHIDFQVKGSSLFYFIYMYSYPYQ